MATEFTILQQPSTHISENQDEKGIVREFPNVRRSHVVAILPRGEAIRNFVYTGALDDIARLTRVTLMSVVPNDDLRQLLMRRYSNVLELRNFQERRVVRTLREILDMAHGRWLWSEAAQERWRLRDREAVPTFRRIKRWAKKLACYPFANTVGLGLLSGVERQSSRLLRNTDYYVRLFEQLNPSLVFNASHVHAGIAVQAVQAAQWLGIPTAAFVFSWDNLTSQGRIVPLYDYYLVWNNAIKEQLLRIYNSVRPEQVLVTGTPQFDFHFRSDFKWTRAEFCDRVGADPARPIVLYTTGMANHMPGEPTIVEGIAKMLRTMTDMGPPQLLVRVYPKDRTDRFKRVKEKYPEVLFPEALWEPNWLTPTPEDSHLLSNMLRHSAVGINIASTVSLELCMFDKPVINVGYNPSEVPTDDVDYSRYYKFDHYRQVVESGAVTVANSEEDLRRKLVEALRHPKDGGRERQALIKKFFGHTLDGWSSKRVAEVINMLVAGHPERSGCQVR